VDVNTQACNFDVANCEVVTAWAAGCTWSDALAISGSPPGDLARTLSRVLDALRQMGNLPYRAIRKSDFVEGYDEISTVARGLHPEIRSLCREAARAINRYPVKDPLQFAEIADEEDIEDELLDNDIEEELVENEYEKDDSPL
jgi:DSHCT (NUC185) domain